MSRMLALLGLLLVLLLGACSAQRFRSPMAFGNRLAREGLWEEARYWWGKTEKEEGLSWQMLNNLGVYHEEKGDLKQAEACYLKALEQSRQNRYIQANLNRLRRRATRRDGEEPSGEKIPLPPPPPREQKP